MHRLAALGAGVGQRDAGQHLTQTIDRALEGGPELFHHGDPVDLTFADAVQLGFEFGGEVVVDILPGVVHQEAAHQLANARWREALFLQHHVFAVLQGLDDAGVGRRAANAELLQRLHQAGFGVTRRRLGEMLLAVETVDWQRFALDQGRQTGVALVGLVVFVFQIHRHEAGEHEGLARCAEYALADGDISGDRVVLRRAHLAGQRALPDHLVEAELLRRQVLADAVRGAADRGRADGFVRLLRVGGGVAVGVGGVRQVAALVVGRVVELAFDVGADLGHGLARQRHRICPHVADEADGAFADVYTFVEPLRSAHGALCGHTELANAFLLQGAGGEGRRGAAGFRCLFDGDDLGVMPLQSGHDGGLPGLIGEAELLDLGALPARQLRREILCSFLRVSLM